jgi:hypothetical protein
MYERFITLAVIALLLSGSTAFAQCGCSAPPVVVSAAPSYSTYYAPAVADYTPAPYVSYYAPAAAPVSYVSYYAPAVAPAPYVTYYAPPAPYVTYYSPRVTYAPVVAPYAAYYGRPGWSIYGAPRVYVPGEPVRNTLKAITP